MTPDTINVDRLEPLTHAEARRLAEAEDTRFLTLLGGLGESEWTRPTDCERWDVRAMAGHVLGNARETPFLRATIRAQLAGRRAARELGLAQTLDGATELQVRAHAHLTVPELLEALAGALPRARRARFRLLPPLRAVPISAMGLRFTLGQLMFVILTRDVWMHRVDICRATGREPVLDPDHDGRLVADVVADWTRRHGQPFELALSGPAGGTFVSGSGGERHDLDAVEFCRILSGRASRPGLFEQKVVF